MVRRGILGGTFDPPHIAHLYAGESAYRELGLDVVTFLPAGAPWQKADDDISPGEHRWEMTRLAVSGVDYFEADDRELRRDGWTYTIDTVLSFTGDDLVLILGSDAAAGFLTWERPDEIAALAEIAVVPRPGAPRSAVDEAIADYRWIDGPALDVSATALRARVASGRSVRFLVPDAVAGYIDAHRLYRTTEPLP